MARISKNIYDKKREWAARKMQEQKKVSSLTEEQHDALESLASIRHDIHTNHKHIIINDEQGYLNKLIIANSQLVDSGLNPIESIPTTLEDAIDTIDLLYQIEEVPEDDDERQKWHDDNYHRIAGELEQLNTQIEEYLKEVDSTHGTSYAPTGKSRIFDNGGSVGNNEKIEINIYTLSEDTDTDSYHYDEIFLSEDDAENFAKTLDTEFEGKDSSININHYQIKDFSKEDLVNDLGYDIEEIDSLELNALILEWAENNDYSEYHLGTFDSGVQFSDYSDKQDDEQRQRDEVEEEQKDLISDFEEKFSNLIHYSERAGYLGRSYYAVLLLNSDNQFVENDPPQFGVEKHEYEKQDFVDSEVVNLGIRTHREKTNFNPKNAVIQIRISDHPEKHKNDINDASLSIAFMPEYELTNPYSQDGYEGKGISYSTGSIGWDIRTEYIVAVNSESDNDSYMYLKMIEDWLYTLDYEELMENREYDYDEFKSGGETSCGCTKMKKDMKKGDFIVHKKYQFSDDRFNIIKELNDNEFVFETFDKGKNMGVTHAPKEYLNNFRLSNDEELESQKEYLKNYNEGFVKYNDGGKINTVDYTWDKLPITFKVDERPTSRQKYKFDFKDTHLRLLTKDFVVNDGIRNNIGGVYFDDIGVVATDGHKVIILPYNDNRIDIRGIYNLHDKSQKTTNVSIGKKIDATFPNYKGVHPNLSKCEKVTVDLAKIRIYTNALIEGFANKITHQVRFLFDDKLFAFNGKFLIQCIDFLMSLGHEYSDLYYSEPNRAIAMLPKGGVLYTDPSVLLMPDIINYTEEDVKSKNILGAEDIDFSYAFYGVYSVIENVILFKDKKYDIQKGISKKEAWEKSEISLTDYKEIEKFSKNNITPILDFCKLENNTLQQTNFINNEQVDVVLNNLHLSGDGIYRYTNLGLLYDNRMSEDNRSEDYPKTSFLVKPDKLSIASTFKINDFEYFKENMKYSFDLAMKDNLRENLSQVFFKSKGNHLYIKSTNAYDIFSNRMVCDSDSDISFMISSKINRSIFNVIDSDLTIDIKTDGSDNGDKVIHFNCINKSLIITSRDNGSNKISEHLESFISSSNNEPYYNYELVSSKEDLTKIFKEILSHTDNGYATIEKDTNGVFNLNFGTNINLVSYPLNVTKKSLERKDFGIFTNNHCKSNEKICLPKENLEHLLKMFNKNEIRFLFNFDNKVNYFDAINFEFDKSLNKDKSYEKSKTKETKTIMETPAEKIIRLQLEIEGYNDLIELADDDVLEGANKIAYYKEVIEGLEMLIELEKDSNTNTEAPIGVIKEDNKEKEINTFIDYVLGFYGYEGDYANDYKGGFSREQVENAVEQYLKDPETNWGGGDSADREIMRDKYLIPLLESMPDLDVVDDKEEKEMIQQKLLNNEWDIASDYNRNYMDKYGFYGSDEFFKNFPVIEDVLIKSDDKIGKVFVGDDGANQIIGKKLHPTGNMYEIKRLNNNTIYTIKEGAIDKFIELMEKSTTEEFKENKRVEELINNLSKDDDFLMKCLDFILKNSPYGVIEEYYLHRDSYTQLINQFLKQHDIIVPENSFSKLRVIKDALRNKYYLKNKNQLKDVLGEKATDSFMNTLWGKKYRYTFGSDKLILNRKQFIDLKVGEGYIIEGEKPNRKFKKPSDNSFYDEQNLTRSELDYAEALINKLKEDEVKSTNVEHPIEKDSVDFVVSEGDLPSRDKKQNIFDKDINYSTRKVLNRADVKMPKDFAEKISEEGITIEELDALEVPVFKYKTQVTIHGIFDLDEDKYRIGGYQSLILNQNKSLGVKYNAIDHEKKKTINNSIIVKSKLEDGERFWYANFDSTGFTVTYKFIFEKEKLKESIDKLKEMYNSIPNLFIGNKNAYILNYMGRYYASIDLHIKAIYEKNLFPLISFITDGFIDSYDSYDEKLNKLELQKEKEREERELEWKKEEEEKQRKIKDIFEPQRDKLISESPYPIVDDIPNSKTFKLAFIVKKEYGGFDAQISVTDYQSFGNKFRKTPFERVSSWEEIENNKLRKKSFYNGKKTISKEDLKRLIDKKTQAGINVFRVDVLKSTSNLEKKDKISFSKWMETNKIDVYKRTYYWVADDGGADPLVVANTKAEVLKQLRDIWAENQK